MCGIWQNKSLFNFINGISTFLNISSYTQKACKACYIIGGAVMHLMAHIRFFALVQGDFDIWWKRVFSWICCINFCTFSINPHFFFFCLMIKNKYYIFSVLSIKDDRSNLLNPSSFHGKSFYKSSIIKKAPATNWRCYL